MYALAKNEGENTLQRQRQREHSANEQWGPRMRNTVRTGSVHQGEKELIMMAHFDMKSIRQEDAAILNTPLSSSNEAAVQTAVSL